MANDVDKRLRYFNGQFLQEQDFNDEQAYHIDRMRRHNRFLHTDGILEGLDVTVEGKEIKVKPGTAVDGEGKFIVLIHESTVKVESKHKNKELLLVISYHEEASDPATVGGKDNTRWHESPIVELFEAKDTPPPKNHIKLARLVIDEKGKVSSEDYKVRLQAGAKVGDELEVKTLTLACAGVDPSEWPTVSSGKSDRADITGSLKVSKDLLIEGNVGMGTTSPGARLEVSGKLTAEKDDQELVGLKIDPEFEDNGKKGVKRHGLIVTDGNVGIGTESPIARLEVSGKLTAEQDDQELVGLKIDPEFEDNGKRGVKHHGLIVTDGSVGIGTENPEARLDVRGILKAGLYTVKGLVFDGEDDYVQIPNMNPDYKDGFTVEAWVYYQSFKKFSRIIDFAGDKGIDDNEIILFNDDEKLGFYVRTDKLYTLFTDPGALKKEEWMHLAATVDANGKAKLYKDGLCIASGDMKCPTSVARTKNYFGKSNHPRPKYVDENFHGKIAEVRIWNRAREAKDIKNDMRMILSGKEDGLVGYWPMNEGSGEKVNDLTPNANGGNISGAQWFEEEFPEIDIGRVGNVGFGIKNPQQPTLVVAGSAIIRGGIEPDYDSGWFPVKAKQNPDNNPALIKEHNLGTIPRQVQMFFSHKENGSPAYIAPIVNYANSDGYNVELTENTAIIRTGIGDAVCQFGQGFKREGVDEGFYRLLLWK